MTVMPASEPDDRLAPYETIADLRADIRTAALREKALREQNRALLDQLDDMKRREKIYAESFCKLIDTPATSVASVRLDGKQWEVIMNTGAVWRRVDKCIHTETETRYFSEWMPRPAVPGSRAAIAQALDDAEPVAPLSLLPRLAS